MRTDSPCKGCSADVRVPPEQIDRMVQKLARFPESCVSDEVYAGRLAVCEACASLQYDSTCAFCGCFVRVRAKLAAQHCPAPGGGRWAE